MTELAISFLVATVFTIALSFGYGRKLTETHAGRPVLGAIGFLIVIAGYSWSKRSLDLFSELVFWFIIVCLPVLIMGVVNTVLEHEQTKREHAAEIERLKAEYQQQLTNRDLEIYSVLDHDRT